MSTKNGRNRLGDKGLQKQGNAGGLPDVYHINFFTFFSPYFFDFSKNP